MLTEVEYRKKVTLFFECFARILETVDPDLMEYDHQAGMIHVTFADHSHCILSTQASLREIWLVISSKNLAHHFKYDEPSHSWRDHRTSLIELQSYLTQCIQESIGIKIEFLPTET